MSSSANIIVSAFFVHSPIRGPSWSAPFFSFLTLPFGGQSVLELRFDLSCPLEHFFTCIVNFEICEKIKNERRQFYDLLRAIPGMTVYAPEANFIFCRLSNDAPSGPIVTEKLFVRHNIYIKHCLEKKMPESDRYLRIASRTQAENKKLVDALLDVLDGRKI